MTMAAHADPRPVCPPTGCRHEQPATGGRCAFYEPNRPGNICGREAVAVYVNDAVQPPMAYRCAIHDRDVAQAEAARRGFRRIETKADRIAALERAVAGGAP
jgi:hypothetical protein